ncbi:MAG: Fe-Mn family superoxide dismutase [archaeon]
MAYEAKNFDILLGVAGFSDNLLKNHFTLYQGYVNNTNKLRELMTAMVKEGKASTPEFAELKRRYGWEFNGMRLHELYFGNMVKGVNKLDKDSKLVKEFVKGLGSYEAWETGFKSVGSMRGVGWVVLYYDPVGKAFSNCWINEHDVGHLSGCVPLLVMDVFEHAFMIDYGLKRADYIESFFKAIDWKVIEGRLEKVI